MRVLLLALLLAGCDPSHHAEPLSRHAGSFQPGMPLGMQSPLVGVWRDNPATFIVWSPDTAQVVIHGVEFWRYPPLQGEKVTGYVVVDGHFADSVFVADGVRFRSLPDSVALNVTASIACAWHEAVPHWTDYADSVYYVPGITGTVTVGISGAKWGAQTLGMPVQAFKEE